MTVIDLQKFKEGQSPHLAGKCRCMLCGHEWAGVAAIGETWLDCPSCGAHKGYFIFNVDGKEGDLYFECKCGCELMRLLAPGPNAKISDAELMCANCGIRHRF